MTFEIDNVSMKFISNKQEEVNALENINLTIESGKFVCFIGPSGCGKTTLLRLMEGFENPTEGTIKDDGEVVLGPSRERGFIFQDYSLFPWLTVLGNVTFGLDIGDEEDEEAHKELAMKNLENVGLKEFANSYPHELSGGMQQRVAIIRSTIMNTRSILMDEPFSALDVQTKRKLQKLLIESWSQRRGTVIFVTHDVDEAVYLADEIVIFTRRPGKIKKIIENDLDRPRDRATEEFINKVLEVTEYIDESNDPV